jgi:signal transduction histidine kinase/DNA-binding response OmpR family regulator
LRAFSIPGEKVLTKRWVLTVAIPLFVVLAIVAFLSVSFAVSERTEQAWVIHTYQVIGRLQGLLSNVQDAEGGQRGYIITRQDRFLERYRSGMAHARQDLDAFAGLTMDNSGQQARSGRLRTLVGQRFKALGVTLENAQTPAEVSPAMLAAMNEGKQRMDALRAEVAQGMAEEDALLAARVSARVLAERNEVIFSSIAAGIALIVLLAAAGLLVRNNRRLEQSEQRLADESAILQATLDNMRDGIAMFAPNGDLRVSNERFFQFFGMSSTDVREGVNLADFEARVLEHSIPKDIFREAADGKDGYRRIALLGRELDVYRTPAPDGGFIIVCSDVTARVLAEQMVKQAQKMEAIGHLTGGVAHDFNNLLQIVGSNLDLAAKDVRGDDKNAERIQNAINAVERGARLTGQLLAFARRQALNPRATNLGRLIQEMTNMLRRTLGERIDVECVVAGGLWNTLVDSGQFENALLNLAINARDAMPEGGKLTLELANSFLDDAYAAQHVEVTAGQYVMVSVSDTGNGIDPKVLARIFDPFFTTKPEGRGTGLGLSQVYGFVKQSGGHIKVYSEIGQGTTLKLYLPRTRKPQEDTGPVVTGPVKGGSECVLVVEDDEDVRYAVCDMLTDFGYTILKAENAEQALVILNSGVAIDLLFTDVVMPGPISTREMARRARELHPNLAVLYTSGYTQNAIVHNGKLDDDVFLLSKPYRRDELARKVRSLLDPRRGPTAAAEPPAGDQSSKAARSKVLVVEDEPLIRMATIDFVEEIGLQAIEAADGEQALSILQSDPDIDLLLTDLGLPGMTGHQLMEEALRLKPDLKIIVMSGRSAEQAAGQAPAQYLSKPFTLAQLRVALKA